MTPALPNALKVAWRALSVVGLVVLPSGASIFLPRSSPATTLMFSRYYAYLSIPMSYMACG
jgi:hypothetical protein